MTGRKETESMFDFLDAKKKKMKQEKEIVYYGDKVEIDHAAIKKEQKKIGNAFRLGQF